MLLPTPFFHPEEQDRKTSGGAAWGWREPGALGTAGM